MFQDVISWPNEKIAKSKEKPTSKTEGDDTNIYRQIVLIFLIANIYFYLRRSQQVNGSYLGILL